MPQESQHATIAWVAGLALALTPVVWRLLNRKKAPANCVSNVPGPSGDTFLEGHLTLLFSNDSWDYHRQLSEKYGQTTRVKGMFGEEFLYTSDPKAMHHIFVKDQYIYEEPYFFTSGNQVVFGPGLLSVTGEQHRKQRKMLNPVFSVAHLRHMVPTFFEIGNQLSDTFFKKVSNGAQEIDIMTWTTRAALEVVGRSGFGTSFSPLTEDAPEHPYATAVKEFGALMTVTVLPRIFILPLVHKYNLGGRWLQRKVLDMVPWKAAHQVRDITDVMHETSVSMFDARRKAMAEEGDSTGEEQRKDMMGVLMRENLRSSEEDRLSNEEVIAQMSTLMIAAMDTTSSALARVLHLLSLNQSVQDRLRAELREAYETFGDSPDHDDLVNLPYLDAVCRETLRLYPPVATITREAQADVLLPLSAPVKGINGVEMSEVFLPTKTNVFVAIRECNTNPRVWGDKSYEWIPERWLEPLPQSVHNSHVPGVYSHLMTFIGGGRACIGFKFSQLEMKVIVYSLVRRFKFTPPKEDIYWQMTFIASPTTDPTLRDLRPKLPLTVSLVEGA